MTELRDVLVVEIVLVAALTVLACPETGGNLEEGAPVATTPAVTAFADETTPMQPDRGYVSGNYACNRGCEK